MEEFDPEAARDAAAVLGWLGWDREGPLWVRRYDVQLFAWYQLPHKWLATLEERRAVLRAFGALLERVGGRAATYADVCRSADTDALLELWERDDPGARGRLRELLDGSGLEPP